MVKMNHSWLTGLSVVVLMMVAMACGDPTDDADDGSPRREESLAETTQIDERDGRSAEVSATKVQRDRDLAEAEIAVQWARDDVCLAEERLKEMQQELNVEQRKAGESRSGRNPIAAESHRNRVQGIRTEISELEHELSDLRAQLKEAEQEHSRLMKEKAGR